MYNTSEKSELLDLTWKKSLPYCNFVLLKPDLAQTDFSEIKNQMRTESAEVRTCHRSEFKNKNTTFSIKQFLYDWAPPAYDHPCLWRNAKISRKENTPVPEVILLGNNYMWYGLDYRRKPAATINMYRTQVELTVLAGDFIVNEVEKIIASLAPVAQNQKDKILNTSLVELTHAHKHNSETISVPTGYLKHLRKVEQKGYFSPASKLPVDLIAPEIVGFDIEGYKLNSVFNFGASSQDIDETEYYFEHVTHKGCYLRIMVTDANNKSAIPYPAIVSDQECNFSEISLDDNLKIYHAWSKKNDNGCHSMIFKVNHLIFNCSIKPAPWTSLNYARDLCQKLDQHIKRENI
jgi:hypothetical protein